MSKHYLAFLLLASFACMTMPSCGRHPDAETDEGADRQIYSPEVNRVDVLTLARADFNRQVISNGRLAASHKTSLSFRSPGTVASTGVRNGQRVRTGQEVARLDAEDRRLSLNAARIAFEKAQVDLLDALVGLGFPAGDTTLVPKDILALAKIRCGWNSAENSLKIAERSYNETILRAPIGGLVADLSVKTFDQVGTGTVCTILDDSAYEIDFPVLETELPLLRSTSKVKVMPYSLPDATPFSGSIEYINPSVGKGGQITVRARIPGNPSLMDGMNAKVVIEQSVPDRLVVPKSAVVVRDNLDVLFRYRHGHAEWVYVKILESSGECYSITANSERGASLHEGDTVIVSGNLNLADGSVVELRQ